MPAPHSPASPAAPASPRDGEGGRTAAPASATDLPARVRAALANRDPREVAMFGGLSFMVDGRMLVACRHDGDLLVRIDPARRGELITRAGAGPVTMGPSRPMGDAWLLVAAGAVTGAGLDTWLTIALEQHAAPSHRRSPRP